MDNWISVKDRLPEDQYDGITAYVVVICKSIEKSKRQTALCSYDYKDKTWTTHWAEEIKNVTYWIKPPKDNG